MTWCACRDAYARCPSIPESLIASGFGPDNVAKVTEDNFIRVFTEVVGS